MTDFTWRRLFRSRSFRNRSVKNRPQTAALGMVVAVAGLAVFAPTLAAQSSDAAGAEDVVRLISSRRAEASNTPIRASVRYGAGSLFISPGRPGQLYALDLAYDAEAFRPVESFTNGRLELGVESARESRRFNLDTDADSQMRVELGTGIAYLLDVEFGAGEARIDLGGLQLADLSLSAGASKTRLDVSQANPQILPHAELEIGASEFTARGLGNLRVQRLEAAVGVGEVTLSFDGAGVESGAVEIQLGLGDLTIEVPEEIGIRVDKDSFLASFDAPDLEERGGSWYSSNWDSAEQRLTFEIDTAFGSIRFVRLP